MSNEFSELQAVDFGLGAYIAAGFDGLNKGRGPKGFQEFLARATNKKIYRHDADTPSEFLKNYLTSKAGAKTVTSGNMNQAVLPIIFYYRKPGLTNGTDRGKILQGRYSFSENKTSGDLVTGYNLMVLPLTFDYKMFFLSWDKMSLDSLQLAWYAYQVKNKKFNVTYKIGDNEDLMEVPAYVTDNKTLLFTNETVMPRQDPGRIYAVSIGLQVSSEILFGEEVKVPEEVVITGTLESYIHYEDGTISS